MMFHPFRVFFFPSFPCLPLQNDRQKRKQTYSFSVLGIALEKWSHLHSVLYAHTHYLRDQIRQITYGETAV